MVGVTLARKKHASLSRFSSVRILWLQRCGIHSLSYAMQKCRSFPTDLLRFFFGQTSHRNAMHKINRYTAEGMWL